ncbi:hypothetical protein CLV24_1134 [Pontibacter ummariensis]|uniref:Acyltransferase family protein n=1 Tax=Pontibacter ummariensis TaxID=1610492 RepID=A0A239HGX7_9BACT|nr:hypothetical protein CLV24_1134 [Pontibacter ummariensis]SNS80617.1 hypothetical protein SAMN06296052_113151 [Pontibacter ummariensis]
MIFISFIPPQALLLFLFAVTSALFFLLVLQFENRGGLGNFLFTNKLVCFTGTISYGIYLYHFPIFYFFGMTHDQLAGRPVPPDLVVVPLLLVFIVPIISFYLLEKPLLKVKSKLDRPKALFRELAPAS